MIKPSTPFLLVFFLAFASTGFAEEPDPATLKKVEKNLEKAERYLYGTRVRKNASTAIRYFLKARKDLPEGECWEGVAVRLSLGLGKAQVEKRKWKDATEEFLPWAKKWADKSFRWTGASYGRGEYVEWMKTLKASKKKIDAGEGLDDVIKAVKGVAEASGKDPRRYKTYTQVAWYLLGEALIKQKNYEDAAGYLQPCAESWVALRDRLAKQEAARKAAAAKVEASRKRTPDEKDIPKTEEPPGKLEGKYFDAVLKALDWLKKYQRENGSWSDASVEEMTADDPLPAPRTRVTHNPATTGLVAMAFLRAGFTPGDERYGASVKKALDWLVANQGPDGRIPKSARGHYMVSNTALSTWALAEAVIRMEDGSAYKPALEKGVGLILLAQNPGMGWRFGIKPGDNETGPTTECLLALARAKLAGVTVPTEAFEGGLKWLDAVTYDAIGRTGSCSRGDVGAIRADAMKFKPVEQATAQALAARVIMGQDPTKGLLAKGYDLLWNRAPKWVPGSDINLPYGRYYTLAYSLRPGADANYNLKQYADMLLEHQDSEKSAAGSWPAAGAWASDGRVMTTARAILSILNARGVNLPEPAGVDLEQK